MLPIIKVSDANGVAATVQHCLRYLKGTLLVVLLFSAPSDGVANGAVAEWSEIQVAAEGPERGQWWRVLETKDLEPFLAAGVDVNLADHRGWSALHSAARYNSDPDIITALLESGAEVNAADRSGDTPLHWAAAENANPAVIEALLEAGAEVNARDRYGWLPLHAAAERNPNPEVIELLLESGSNKNQRAYFVFFKPEFLLKRNKNMSEKDREEALAKFEQ